MGVKEEKLLIEYLISSPETFAICTSIIKPEYFDPNLQDTVHFLQTYYDEYNGLPEPDLIDAKTNVKLLLRDVSKDKIEFCTNEIEAFCKRKAIQAAIVASMDLYKEKKFDKIEALIKNAVLVSLHRDMGIDFFVDPIKRLKYYLENDPVEPIGWKEFDEALDGGIVRKQLLLLQANSGVGKSIVMQNIGLNFVEKGFTVLLISLELPAEMIDIRAVQMVTGQDKSWKKNIENTAQLIESKRKNLEVKDEQGNIRNGSLHIKRMPNGTNSNQIRAFLKEFELRNNKIPDMIIVDYLDLMSDNAGTPQHQIFAKDKGASEELREIGEDYNAWMVSASQQNRGAITAAELHQGHIAGGISKINTTDVSVSIIMTDKMRHEGSIGFQFLKTRTSGGVGKTVYSGFNPKTLRITDRTQMDFSNINNEPDTASEPDDSDDGIIIEENKEGLLSFNKFF